MMKTKLLTILVIILCPLRTMCQFNMTDYRKMPPLYTLEDFDACLENSKPSSYCLVVGEIVPNTTSGLWTQIANFSSDFKRNFRHNYLYFGVCLNSCKQLVHPFSTFRKDQLYAGKVKNPELIEFLTDINQRDSDSRILNHKVINTCLNYNFEKQYDLQVRSFVQYCVSNDEPSNFDYLEITFMVLVGILLLLVVLSTNYDRQLKSNQQGNDINQQKVNTQQDTLFTSFSLYRNYNRLIAPSRSETAKDLKFLEAFRFFTTLLVILAHVTLLLKSMPLKNTEFVEKTFHQFGISMISNATVFIQIFLAMSSFLLCVSFQQTTALKKPGFTNWIRLVVNRYLRLAPSLAFTILINASILPRLQDGPFWRHYVEAEHVLCRETWWSNLLFINNFTWKKSCLHQTWYLAADFQLYVIFAAVLIIIARFPKTRNYILGAGVLISVLIPGMVTYFLKLDPFHHETPDTYRYLFWTDSHETIYNSYIPFYTNFGGFVFGTIAALMYLKYKKEGLILKEEKKSKLNTIVMLLLPLPVLLLLTGEIFYQYEFTKPSIWISIYAGLFRNIWVIMCCAMLLLNAFKIGSILYEMLSMKIFMPLGRISFQVYLIHSIVVRCLGGCARQPIYLNYLILNMYYLASVVISFIAAFVLYLVVELPIANIIDSLGKGSDKPAKDVDSCPLNVKNKEETTST